MADRTAVFTSILGLLSLIPGWFTLRPNRLTSGEGLNLAAASGWMIFGLMLVIWAASLLLSLRLTRKNRWLICALASTIPGLVLFVAGETARNLIQQSGEGSRVSISGGIWLSLVSAYVLLYVGTSKATGMLKNLSIIFWLAAIFFPVLLLAAGRLDQLSVIQEVLAQKSRFVREAINHVKLAGISVLIGMIVGLPFGVWATRNSRAAAGIFFFTNVTQTIPSMALFGLLIAPLSFISFAFPTLREIGVRGIGTAPALIALTVYALLPIVRNTYQGLRSVNSDVLEAGRGMGMTGHQVFRRLQVPLAAPFIVEGMRISSVQAVGNTAVAALIGAGGLGFFIFQGLGQAAPDLILAGAVPIVIMAVFVDELMRLAVKAVTPRSLK